MLHPTPYIHTSLSLRSLNTTSLRAFASEGLRSSKSQLGLIDVNSRLSLLNFNAEKIEVNAYFFIFNISHAKTQCFIFETNYLSKLSKNNAYKINVMKIKRVIELSQIILPFI